MHQGIASEFLDAVTEKQKTFASPYSPNWEDLSMDGQLSSQTPKCDAKSFQSCLTLWDPKYLPGSSILGLLHARILKWVAFLQGIFLTQGSNPGLLVSCIGKQVLYH